MSKQRADLVRIAAGAALGALLGLAALLGGCRSAPAPAITPGPIAVTETPIARPAVIATLALAASPAATAPPAAPSPTAAPTSPAAATAAATAPVSTPTHVVRFIPTITPAADASPLPPPTASLTPASRTTPAPVVRATATRPPPISERDWDPRLTQRGAQLIPARVQPGQGYWRLVKARWFDVDDPPFTGKHFIFFDTLDQAGQRKTGVPIQLATFDMKEVFGSIPTEAKPGELYAGSFPMQVVAPAYRIEPADGAPADAVTNLGLGSIAVPDLPMLTSYGFTWQWTVAR